MKEMLNAKEVAEYLDIHEKQLYRLVKERKIPATRLTGKWLFPKALIDECIMKSARERVGIPLNDSISENQVVIAGTNDPALELLIKNANLQNPRYPVLLISNLGGVAGLSALQRRICHVAACNLLDLETGKYNSTFIKRTFPELDVVILNLAYREQGLLLKRGNPLGIKTLRCR
jgi:excisionase family DNA binding protein